MSLSPVLHRSSGAPPLSPSLPASMPVYIPREEDSGNHQELQHHQEYKKDRERREKALAVLEPIWKSTSWLDLNPGEVQAIEQVKNRLFTGYITILPEPTSTALDVVLQREYKGFEAVIPTPLADIPCSKFTVAQLLLCLNSLLYTVRDTGHPHLPQVLQSYIDDRTIDFGMAYALLRPHWGLDDDWGFNAFRDFIEKTRQEQEQFEKCRSSMVKGEIIVSSEVPPRRLWDLHSNRVILASLTRGRNPQSPHHSRCIPGEKASCWTASCYAVSHSWVDRPERQYVSSKINGAQWRIPIPRDISLERIRVEVLNSIEQERTDYDLGDATSYAWMDVLCLRQEDTEAPDNHLVPQEQAIDVPTIGFVYQECTYVIHYFCGLGRPFIYGNEDGERHWFNRAWTLQEVGAKGSDFFRAITGGITSYSPPDPWKNLDSESTTEPDDNPFQKKHKAVRSLAPHAYFDCLVEMRQRFSTKPVDQIAGLLYPLVVQKVYVYSTQETVEQAWEKLLSVLRPEAIASISVGYPFSGEGKSRFLPSWNQIQRLDLSAFKTNRNDLFDLHPWKLSLDEDGVYRGTFPLFVGCCIANAAPVAPIMEPLVEDQKPSSRNGTITFSLGVDDDGQSRSVTKDCIFPVGVEPGVYALVLVWGAGDEKGIDWNRENTGGISLIGKWYPESKSFSKIAALTILRESLGDRLEDLHGDVQDITFL